MSKRATYTINLYNKNFDFKILEFGVTSRKKCYAMVKKAFKNKRYVQARVMSDVDTLQEDKRFEKWIENKTGEGYFIDVPTIGNRKLSKPLYCSHCGNDDIYVGHLMTTTLGVECRNLKCGANIGVDYGNTDYMSRTLAQYEKDLTEMALRRWNKRYRKEV